MDKDTKKSKKWISYTIFLIAFILLAFMAGIFGEFFTRYYLSKISFFSDLYFTDQTNLGQKDIVINEPRKVVVEQNMRLDQIKGDIEPVLAGIYRKKAITKNALDSIYLPEDYLGEASILTSDGWLVTTQNANVIAGQDVIVTNNNKIYEIEKVVIDTATNIAFIKISVQNLPVIKFAEYKDITDGESVVVYSNILGRINLSQVLTKKYKEINNKYDYVSSSQILNKYILLDRNYSDVYKGSAVFDFEGNVIGLLRNDGLVIPINYIKPVITYVLRDEKIKRPYLGVNYINLSNVSGLSSALVQDQETGAMIWNNAANKSVSADSPLINKLAKGDIITSIEGQKIDANNDLIDLLLEYKTGQEIKIKYMKTGQEGELSITLK
jgi:serine protease Do